jgi:isopenicillin-N N-acyltransferase-like protein
MTDVGFPVIQYERGKSPIEWGRAHGESFRDAIRELVEIRRNLMRQKNPSLTRYHLDRLAHLQWRESEKFDHRLTLELRGICEGSELSVTDVVILNNYTDFRDIQLPEEGCSLAYVNNRQGPLVGQTWDMHGSAKRFVCALEVPDEHSDDHAVLFSVVGCTGMMGFTTHGSALGVNNINTANARASVMWPIMVRAILQKKNQHDMVECLTSTPKTSGHNYLVATRDDAEMWEVAPDLNERVGHLRPGQQGFLLHTNHCLGQEIVKHELTVSQNSTTHIRLGLLEKKIGHVKTLDDMYELMTDHENYPKSICSNFQTDTQDPSITCGGAVGSLKTGVVRMWRGDPLYDDNFVLREFQL